MSEEIERDTAADRERAWERDMVLRVRQLRERTMENLDAGKMVTKIKMPTLTLLWFLDEMENRNPRNWSALVRDTFMERLEGEIDRLHGEVLRLSVDGPHRRGRLHR